MTRLFVFGLRGFPNVQGGVEIHSQELYKRLAVDRNIEITVFRRKPYLTKGKIPIEGICFKDLPSTKIKGFEALFHSFICTILSIYYKPDLVHIHNFGPALFIPLLKLFRIKVIITYHSQNYLHKKWGFLSRLLLKFSEKLVYKFSDRIIFVGKHLIPENKKLIYNIIPNGVNFNYDVDEILINQFGLIKKKYIFFAGRISEEKGVLDLVYSFLKLKNNDFKLVITGGVDHNSDYSKQVTDLALNNDKIVLTGFVSGKSLHSLFNFAHTFVLPSYFEGLPIVLLEAMSYNLNLIVSNIQANKALDLPEEVYFETGNIIDLTKKIDEVLESEQKHNYSDIIREKYNWDNIAQHTLKVYHEVTLE